MRRVLFIVLATVGCASGSAPIMLHSFHDAGEDTDFDSTIPEASTIDSYVRQDALIPYDGPIDECDPFSTCLDGAPDGPPPVDTDADYARTYVSSSISVAGSVGIDLGNAGATISSTDIPGIIAANIASSALPWDPNGIYFFLTSSEVNVDDGAFCGEWCGFHESSPFTPDGGTQTYLHYAVTGDTGSCWQACSGFAYEFPTPNDNLSADTMVSVIAHELAESATDPLVLIDNAWLGDGEEICDECSYEYGSVYKLTAGLGNGAPYNVQVGGSPFLVQQVWQMGPWSTEHCTVGIDGNPGFDASGATPDSDGGVIAVDDWQSPMRYWGGPVMTQPISVYFVWYGEWPNRSSVEPIITGFVNGLSSTPWWGVVDGYFSEVVPVEGGADE
jgi:hypothetical protein